MVLKNGQNLKIIFWNTRSFQQRREEIELLLKDIDTFICVESNLSPQTSVHVSGFLTYRQDRITTTGGGILFLIKKSLAFHTIKNVISPDASVEICGIKITKTSPPLDIIACYRSPCLTLSQSFWDTIVQNVNSNNCCLLLGDFNAHNTNWNCRNTDANGTINNQNMIIHNENTTTYIDIHRDISSNIDLIASTNKFAEKINVTALDETLGSNHYPLYVEISAKKNFYKKKNL